MRASTPATAPLLRERLVAAAQPVEGEHAREAHERVVGC